MCRTLTQCFPPVVGGIKNLLGGLAQALSTHGKKVLVFADATDLVEAGENIFALRRFGKTLHP